MQMPVSAMAKLNTRKLLGVLSSLTLRKATIVTAFRRKPSRPFGRAEKKCLQPYVLQPVRTSSVITTQANNGTVSDDCIHLFVYTPPEDVVFRNDRNNALILYGISVREVTGSRLGKCGASRALFMSGRIPREKHSPSTSRQDPSKNTSNSEKPSGKGYDVTILAAI